MLESVRSQRPPDRRHLEPLMAQAHEAMAATGGIVTLEEQPTVVVTDLHARRDYLMAALQHDATLERLQQGRVNVLCLGDGLHSEGRGAARWQKAAFERDIGRTTAMQQEMAEGLGLMRMVMELKTAFPRHFHFLRGNHEDVNGADWMKYAAPYGESLLTREWMQGFYGEDFVERYAAFEQAMPLLAMGPGFVASHAPPSRPLTREAIEARDPAAFRALAWTSGCHEEAFRSTLQALQAPPATTWIVGHRPVDEGLSRPMLGGQLIQINAPEAHVIALFDTAGNVTVKGL